MDRPGQPLTLRVFAILWVFLPLLFVMSGFLAAGALAFEQLLTDLLVDRHRQIAATAAIGVSDVIEGYAHILEALAGNPDILHRSLDRREQVLENASAALEVFNAGVAVLDRSGGLVTTSATEPILSEGSFSQQETYQQIQAAKAPVFSELVFDPSSSENFILVSVPITDEGGGFQGALFGAVRTRTATFSQPIKRLTVGKDGFAYLVDGNGKVIFHPDETQIGADYADQSFYRQVIADRNAGTLWRSGSGARLFEADASVAATGWALIVQESWESAVAPAQPYALAAVIVGLSAVLFVVFISWQGLRRISLPILLLGEQTARLSRGESLEAFRKTGIREIDELESAFAEMARQITTYRAGLHRYIDALTQTQENERRRIARELHDETVQNLLAVSRRLELYGMLENEPAKQERLGELQEVTRETLNGIRRISRDLRPLILEDLGLIPALQTLTRALRDGEGAVPHVSFEVAGEIVMLPAELELAIYRITQEALNNIRRHAQATGAQVKLSFHSEMVTLEVEDDGKGFKLPESLVDYSHHGNFGLIGIQERVWALGGRFTIRSDSGRGALLQVEIPLLNG